MRTFLSLRPLALLPLLFLLGACSDEFLDRAPINGYTSENFFEDEEQITQAVNGLYPIIRNLTINNYWVFTEFRSDNTTFQYNAADRGNEAYERIDYFQADATNGTLSNIWNSSYTNISRANFVLASLADAVFDNEENRIIREAEARFVRAFMYTNLTKLYGPVPLVDDVLLGESEAVNLRRAPLDDIYNTLIVPDFQFAIDNLPAVWNAANEGRASGHAARVGLAKAYFQRRNYAAALPLLNAVIESGDYALMQQYRDVFDPLLEASNTEVIFAAENDVAAGFGAGFFFNWLPQNSGTDITQSQTFIGGLAGRHIPSCDMIEAYEPGDRRFDAGVGIYVADPEMPDTAYYIRKYVFPPVLPTGSDTDWPIFRYADVLLMQAEALLETQGGLVNEVFTTLNALRARANLPLYFPGNPNPALDLNTEAQLRTALRQERRIEMAFEGDRFYDLVRYGTLDETMRTHGEEQQVKQAEFLEVLGGGYDNITEYIGLPAQQVLLYEYEQNPGW